MAQNENQLTLIDTLNHAELWYMQTGRTDYWQQSDKLMVDNNGYLIYKEQYYDKSRYYNGRG